MGKSGNTHRHYAIYLLLIVITVAVYWPVLRNGFVKLDDPGYVTDNPHVQQGLTARSITWAFTPASTRLTANWHPLTYISHMADCQIYHLNPMGHHLTSLLFHIANTLLLFLVLTLMTGSRWRSAFVAALFAVHPLHVESVGWVSERKDVLSSFFWLLTMLVYIGYAKKPELKRYLLVAGSFVLGLMAKPMLVSLPIVLLLMDYWPLGRIAPGKAGKPSGRRVFRQLVLEKAPLMALSAIVSVVTLLAQTKGCSAVIPLKDLPFGVRLANAAVAYIEYIVKMLWPRGLAVFYPHPLHSIPMWQVVGSTVLLFAGFAFAVRVRKRYPHVFVGWMWYVVTLIPVIGLIQVGQQAMADRYTYLSLIGIFIIVVWSVPAGFERKLAVPCAAIVGILMVCTCHQASYWRNTVTLAKHALACTTDNYAAYILFGNGLNEGHRFKEAEVQFRKAMAIAPTDPLSYSDLGITLMGQGKLQAAADEFHAALALKPDLVGAQASLGHVLGVQGKLTEAIAWDRKALRLSPDESMVHLDLGHLLVRQGKLDEALEHLYIAANAKPAPADANLELGIALLAVGRPEEAAVQCFEAVRLNPRDPLAYCNLAMALQQLGRNPEAVKALRQALRISPTSWEAANTLAWTYATSPAYHNPSEALRLAEMASRLTHNKDHHVLDTLAAAYAVNGQYARASATEKKAMDLMAPSKQDDSFTRMRERLELYKSQRPWVNK